jgi:hypothetical protein
MQNLKTVAHAEEVFENGTAVDVFALKRRPLHSTASPYPVTP